jgi:hypothetical protein
VRQGLALILGRLGKIHNVSLSPASIASHVRGEGILLGMDNLLVMTKRRMLLSSLLADRGNMTHHVSYLCCKTSCVTFSCSRLASLVQPNVV